MMKEFPCSGCGLCCQFVDRVPELKALDRGDGICSKYDTENRQCQIYDTRPDICRVDRQYKLNYAGQLSWEDFIALNAKGCRQLQHEHPGGRRYPAS